MKPGSVLKVLDFMRHHGWTRAADWEWLADVASRMATEVKKAHE